MSFSLFYFFFFRFILFVLFILRCKNLFFYIDVLIFMFSIFLYYSFIQLIFAFIVCLCFHGWYLSLWIDNPLLKALVLLCLFFVIYNKFFVRRDSGLCITLSLLFSFFLRVRILLLSSQYLYLINIHDISFVSLSSESFYDLFFDFFYLFFCWSL